MRVISDLMRFVRLAALVSFDLIRPSRPEYRLRVPPGRLAR